MNQESEAAWAAGIFEGEGCFAVDRRCHGSPRLRVTMTDEDVIRRLHQAVGGRGSVCAVSRKDSKPHWKQPWLWTVTNEEDVLAVVTMFLPWLGERRRARWDEIWSAWMKHCDSLQRKCESCGEHLIARDHRSRFCNAPPCRKARNKRAKRLWYVRTVVEPRERVAT